MSRIVGICSTRHACLAVKRSVLPAIQWQLAQPRLPVVYSTRRVSKESMKFPDAIAPDKGAIPTAAAKNAETDRPLPWFGSGASEYETAETFLGRKKSKKRGGPFIFRRPSVLLSILVWMLYVMFYHDEQEKTEILNASMYPVLGGAKLEKHDLEYKIKFRRLVGKETILEEYRLAEVLTDLARQEKSSRNRY